MCYTPSTMGLSVSLPVNDLDHYIIIRQFLVCIFNALPVFIFQWEIQTYLHTTFLR